MDEGEDDDGIPTEYFIPGLPFLSKKIKIGSPVGGGNLLERDLALYDQKAKDYLTKIVCEARASGSSELKVPDPLRFWLTQVFTMACVDLTLHIILFF